MKEKTKPAIEKTYFVWKNYIEEKEKKYCQAYDDLRNGLHSLVCKIYSDLNTSVILIKTVSTKLDNDSARKLLAKSVHFVCFKKNTII